MLVSYDYIDIGIDIPAPAATHRWWTWLHWPKLHAFKRGASLLDREKLAPGPGAPEPEPEPEPAEEEHRTYLLPASSHAPVIRLHQGLRNTYRNYTNDF